MANRFTKGKGYLVRSAQAVLFAQYFVRQNDSYNFD
jgi:hypothetical protein